MCSIWISPIRPALFLWGGGGGVAWAGGRQKMPTAHNSKTIHGIGMKVGRMVDNHKLTNLE